MSTTYIAGYDGSPAAKSALVMAAALADATGAELIAAHTAPYEPHPRHDSDSAYSRVIDADARELLAAATAEFPEAAFKTRVIAAGSPARGLHELAEETGASLLAIGATERGRLTSVPERLLSGAPCPTLVVPAREDGASGVHIIAVAFDGEKDSFAAAREAERLALACGASLRLIAVFEPSSMSATMTPGNSVYQSMRKWLDAQVEAILEKLSPEVRAEPIVVKGHAETEIVNACGAGVDLLVTGSRGFGPIQAVLLGSVSHKLVRDLPCPVLVVPRCWRDLEDERDGLEAQTSEAK